jgi:hypothetical protein
MSKQNPHLFSDVRNTCPHCKKVQSNTEICFFCHKEMLPSKAEQIESLKALSQNLLDAQAERDTLKARCEKLEGVIGKLINPKVEFRGCPTCAHGTINQHSWPDCPYLAQKICSNRAKTI